LTMAATKLRDLRFVGEVQNNWLEQRLTIRAN